MGSKISNDKKSRERKITQVISLTFGYTRTNESATNTSNPYAIVAAAAATTPHRRKHSSSPPAADYTLTQ